MAGWRVGYSEIPVDNRQYEWDYTLNLDFWQSEFVFYRVQYQYNARNINSLPENRAMISFKSYARISVLMGNGTA